MLFVFNKNNRIDIGSSSPLVSPLLSLYAGFKANSSIKIFGISTIPTLDSQSSFSEYVRAFLPFILSQTNGLIIIMIIALSTLLSAIVLTGLCTITWIAYKKEEPSWLYVILYNSFSGIFIISLIFFISFLYYASYFYENFPLIPRVMVDSIKRVNNSLYYGINELISNPPCFQVMRTRYDYLYTSFYIGIHRLNLIVSYFNLEGDMMKIVKPLSYSMFAIMLFFYSIQTAAFVTQSKFSRIFATIHSTICIVLAIMFGIIAVVSTAIAVSAQDLCINSKEFAANWINNNYLYKLPPIPSSVFDSNELYIEQLLEPSICSTSQSVSNSELYYSYAQIKSLFCVNVPSYFGSLSVSLHLYLISLIGFMIIVLIQRMNMLTDNEKINFNVENKSAKFGQNEVEFDNNRQDESSDFEPYKQDIVGYL